jgi:hypothetical protein
LSSSRHTDQTLASLCNYRCFCCCCDAQQLDIALNFLTGVRRLNHDTGMIEYCYSMRAVAAAYAKSWLLLDVLSALPVECLLVLGVGGQNYNLGHLNRWGAVIW